MISKVLNLIINGIPSIPFLMSSEDEEIIEVLNLIINGIPSIQPINHRIYKDYEYLVLNLIINGIPSIHKKFASEQEANTWF